MADNIPQWPFMPGIQGQVPLPRPDPRSAHDKSLAFAQALMGKQTPAQPTVPMPRPDPRNWAERALPQVNNAEYNLSGAIHPDSLLQARGYQPTRPSIDKNTFGQGSIEDITRNSLQLRQRPLGNPPPVYQQDVGNGLFGVPHQHLQQMAGDVVPFPGTGAGATGDAANKKALGNIGQGTAPIDPTNLLALPGLVDRYNATKLVRF